MTIHDRAVIGVDLGGTKVAAGRVRAGVVDEIAVSTVPADEPRDVVFETISRTIDEVMTAEVTAIGFGAPSVVDVSEGVVREVGNIPSWTSVPLRSLLEERFGLPAVIDNDANAFALGEFVFGAGRGRRHLVGMTLGTGLGTGVIHDGRLLHGANCGVGELGKTDRKGMRLEDWCASPYFEREWGAPAELLHRRAAAGDPEALRAFRAYGAELSTAVSRALYLFDPEVLVLGGSISSAFSLFEDGIWAGLAGFAYPHIVEHVTVVPSTLEHAAVLGAASLVVELATD